MLLKLLLPGKLEVEESKNLRKYVIICGLYFKLFLTNCHFVVEVYVSTNKTPGRNDELDHGFDH